MRVLNAYAGIGGNRHLWPEDWDITAVELHPRVAAEYARRYPADTVVTADAHAFVLAHAHEFDAVWTSPPCPTHSRLARAAAARTGRALQPDPRLWDEIAHLRSLHESAGRSYVVENVHTYYMPPVPPDLVTDRHYYWASGVPLLLTPVVGLRFHDSELTADGYADLYGLPRIPWGAVPSARTAFRNAVVPVEGLEVASAAFSGTLVH